MQKQFQIPEIPTPESWLAKYKSRHSTDENAKTTTVMWTYPPQLEMRTDLPPSVRKLNPEDLVDDDFAEWGE